MGPDSAQLGVPFRNLDNCYQDTSFLHPSMSVAQRLRSALMSHGLAAGAASVAAYKAWCAANPDSRICGSQKSIVQFAEHTLKQYGPTGTVQAAASSPVSLAPPVSYGSQLRVRHDVKGCGGGCIEINATDLLTIVSTPASTAQGTRLFSFAFQPFAEPFAETRFRAYAQLFEKYDVKSLKFHYQPACSTATNGQIILAWDNDPSDSPPQQDEAGLRQLFSYRSNMLVSAFAPATLSCALDKSTNSLFTSPANGDARLISPGQLIVANVTGLPSSTTVGSLWVSYTVKLSSPSELGVGPTDTFVTVSLPGGMAMSATSSLVNTLVNAGATVTSNGVLNVQVGQSGVRGIFLPVGTWIGEVILSVSNAVAGGLTWSNSQPVGSTSPGSLAYGNSASSSVFSTTGSTQTVIARSILQVSFNPIVAFPVWSSGTTFGSCWIRVAPYGGNINAAGIDSYGF